MKKLLPMTCLALWTSLSALGAVPLTESTFTEIIRVANVINATNKAVAPAKVHEVFRAPDLVRTGEGSRIEMTAPDKTITRVGANTIFTFAKSGRDIMLEAGSVLFHSPKGAGGGSVNYRGTSAAVLGTTMICAVLPDHRYKVMDLEGQVKVTLRDNRFVVLEPGQMVIVTPTGDDFGEVENFRISEVISRLILTVGYSDFLASLPLIEEAARAQEAAIAGGSSSVMVPFNYAVFGLDIVFRLRDSDIPVLPPQTPDQTKRVVSPDTL